MGERTEEGGEGWLHAMTTPHATLSDKEPIEHIGAVDSTRQVLLHALLDKRAF